MSDYQGLLWDYFYASQHYQKDADGLSSRLKHSIDKTKDVEFVVSMSDFQASTFLVTYSQFFYCLLLISPYIQEAGQYQEKI